MRAPDAARARPGPQVEHLLRKTGAASLAEVTALAVRDGLLRPAPADVERLVERAPGG